MKKINFKELNFIRLLKICAYIIFPIFYAYRRSKPIDNEKSSILTFEEYRIVNALEIHNEVWNFDYHQRQDHLAQVIARRYLGYLKVCNCVTVELSDDVYDSGFYLNKKMLSYNDCLSQHAFEYYKLIFDDRIRKFKAMDMIYEKYDN